MAERSVEFKGFRLRVDVPDRIAQGMRRVVGRRDEPVGRRELELGGARTVAYERRTAEAGIPLVQERIDWRLAHGADDSGSDDPESVARAVDGWAWYHTIELPHGIVTRGVYDHRPLVPHYRIPVDLEGKRVLDVATADGFWAFEFERRGAKVTAIDIESTSEIDIPAQVKLLAAERGYDDPIGNGFALAHRLLGSQVEKVAGSIYDLDPDRLGRFDLVHAGDILLHLRDPVLALQQIRRVTSGQALLADVFDPALSGAGKGRRGLVRYHGGWNTTGWWIPSLETLVQMIADAGFADVDVVNTYHLSPPGMSGGPWRAVVHAI